MPGSKGVSTMTFHEPPTIFASRIHLNVGDLERSRTFYQDVLGLRVLNKNDRSMVFTANGADPLLTIEQTPLVLARRSRMAGLYHFALLLPTRNDLAAAMVRLLKVSYPLQGGADHAVSEAIYLADPDGNGIELYRDRPPEQWKWRDGRVFMPTDALDEHILEDWDGSRWQGLPGETILGHMHLQVADLRKTETFYCQGLGFDLVAQYGKEADFLSTGGYHHHIGLNTWRSRGNPQPDENAVGMKNFTLCYPNQGTLEASVRRLREMGMTVRDEEGALTVRDPSNIEILLTATGAS